METRTYTEKSNARRAARIAGIDPNLVIETEDGFTFTPPDETETNGHDHAEQTHPLVEAVNAAVDRGISAKEFVAIAEGVADELDTPAPKVDDAVPTFCKISPEDRKAAWANNPPQVAPIKETTVTKTSKAKSAKPKGAKGADKTATLVSMLKGKGSTVDQLTKATGWLAHTLRARISGLAKPKSKGGEGLKIERERTDGVTSYRIAS